jgi:hypothetical protein
LERAASADLTALAIVSIKSHATAQPLGRDKTPMNSPKPRRRPAAWIHKFVWNDDLTNKNVA